MSRSLKYAFIIGCRARQKCKAGFKQGRGNQEWIMILEKAVRNKIKESEMNLRGFSIVIKKSITPMDVLLAALYF